ncbi:hypothetical protein ACG2OD_24550 [Streptomyces sp. PDY-4]|uniref:hypothetical protein n=1 Tax=Streptomyces sp. PDY-4 TaxID=3376070 RepID=UPI00379CDDB9
MLVTVARPAREGIHPDPDAPAAAGCRGASPDTESGGLGSEGTPLCAAASRGHTETERELLAHGADPDLREGLGVGRSPLHRANSGPTRRP